MQSLFHEKIKPLNHWMNNFSKFNIFGFLFLKLVNLQNLLMNFNTDELLHSNISTLKQSAGGHRRRLSHSR